MTVKLKSIRLKNYCGYVDSTIDFTDKKGNVKQMACFYGENGFGKSTLLYASDMLGGAYRYMDRVNDQLFKKLVHHKNYIPGLGAFLKNKRKMNLTGIFDCNGEDKKVIIDDKGVVKNELPDKDSYPREHVYRLDADNPVNLGKFSVHAEFKDIFLELTHTIYDFDVILGECSGDLNDKSEAFYNDVIIRKIIPHRKTKTLVHFKRMSDGEKKIAKLCEALCNPIWIKNVDIIAIDNAECHVYMARHEKMIKKILELFPNKQFLITTHSPILVGWDKYPGCLDKKYLYNVAKI